MAELIRSGQVADLVLLCLALEAAGLAAYRWRTGRGLGMAAVAALVLPGVMLALALRAGLTGAWWGWVGVWLAGALIAHVADLHQRLRALPGAGAESRD
jgi:ABC-type spermidine/putrescine transport system permease subunit II